MKTIRKRCVDAIQNGIVYGIEFLYCHLNVYIRRAISHSHVIYISFVSLESVFVPVIT